MDPPAIMNEGPYKLAEIWQLPVNGVGGPVGLGRFADLNRIGGGCSGGDDPVCRKRKEAEDDQVKAGVSTSNGNGSGSGLNDGGGDRKRIKTTVNKMDESCDGRAEGTGHSAGKTVEQKASQPAEPPKQDYIHVRARRGQATDSHSLAERARREKISERMKILQDLVPGCNKVIGKALVLDEIINYIQSLQRQVEFLSMKLEAVNSRMTPGIEVFLAKDFGQETFDPAGVPFGSQATRGYSPGPCPEPCPEWLHMQVGGGFERTS